MDDWKSTIQSILDEVIEKEKLPKEGLFLAENLGKIGGKNEGKVVSYSICIYEPEYPELKRDNKTLIRNGVVMNIQEKSKYLEFVMSDIQFNDVQVPEDVTGKCTASMSNIVKASIKKDSPNLRHYVLDHIYYGMANYRTKSTAFGCCSRFNECSDALCCVHENKFYSKACMYRMNLSQGKVFYGTNKNIDEHGNIVRPIKTNVNW